MNFADPTAKLFMLTRIVAATQEGDSSMLTQLECAGVEADVLERLRGMPLGEVWRFVGGDCGMAVTVNVTAMRLHLRRMDASKADRETLEYLIRHGASVGLLSQLYALSPTLVRAKRRELTSSPMQGGRPKAPCEEDCQRIVTRWQELLQCESCPRLRMRRLHETFTQWPICSLELVVLDGPSWPALVSAARAPTR